MADEITYHADPNVISYIGDKVRKNFLYLNQGTDIPANSDLDNYTTPGTYNCVSSTIAKSLSHCPITDEGFTLIVLRTNSNSVKQIIHGNVLGKNYTRRCLENTWSAWIANGGVDAIYGINICETDSDWSWIKWCGGGCIAWKSQFNSKNAITQAKGSLYFGYSQIIPFPFDIFYPQVSVMGWGDIDLWKIQSLSVNSVAVYPISSNSIASTNYTYGSVIVTGRWK